MKGTNPLVVLQPTACQCKRCKSMCRRPCWPTPDDADRLIAAGLGNRLMLDLWIGDGPDGDDILILCPANPGYETELAPDSGGSMSSALSIMMGLSRLESGCVFHNKSGLCDLHDRGLKPTEGKLAIHGMNSNDLHQAVAMEWNNAKARELVSTWRSEHGV